MGPKGDHFGGRESDPKTGTKSDHFRGRIKSAERGPGKHFLVVGESVKGDPKKHILGLG